MENKITEQRSVWILKMNIKAAHGLIFSVISVMGIAALLCLKAGVALDEIKKMEVLKSEIRRNQNIIRVRLINEQKK